jgi:hypothetical protein
VHAGTAARGKGRRAEQQRRDGSVVQHAALDRSPGGVEPGLRFDGGVEGARDQLVDRGVAVAAVVGAGPGLEQRL